MIGCVPNSPCRGTGWKRLLEHTKVEAASQLAELNKKLSKKHAALKRARVQLKEKSDAMSALESRERSLRRQLRAAAPSEKRLASRAASRARIGGVAPRRTAQASLN